MRCVIRSQRQSRGDLRSVTEFTIVHDYCASLFDYGAVCLSGGISVWEQLGQQTYRISNSRYVMTFGDSIRAAGTDHSHSIIEFGRCALQ